MLPGSAVELDAVEMQGTRISLEVSGKVYEATVCHDKDDAGCGGPVNGSYYLKYKKKAGSRWRSKANGWVNLELPVGEKCSWWRTVTKHATKAPDRMETGQVPKVAW